MTCKNCTVGTIQFRVKLTGSNNQAMKQIAIEHLARLGYVISEENGILFVRQQPAT